MKKIIAALLFMGVSLTIFVPVQARDTKLLLPIDMAMASKNDVKNGMDDSVKFYFGKQKHPQIVTRLGSDSTNKKTNAFGKPDEKACNWAFLSALVALEKRAQSLGANAVINIVSNYNRNQFSSNTEFECHAGAVMAGVALKGDFVKTAEK